MEFSNWSRLARDRVDAVLAQALEQRKTMPQGRGDAILQEGMAYGVLGAGKRVRALLAIAAGESVGAPAAWCDSVGAAIECIHAFSLVHDDMPCMDDDALRRGQPTVHVKYGEAQALLVGDALQTLGFELIADIPAPAPTVVRLVKILSVATGLQGMAGGQAVDIEAVGKAMRQDQLEAMHGLKTGALIAASVEMGACCATPSVTDMGALKSFASLIGLSFQVADDVLDVSADAKTLGKTPGKDAAANKPTFVALLGLEGAQGYARDLHARALSAIEPLGSRADALRGLANALLTRTH